MYTEVTAQHHPAQETHHNIAEPAMEVVALESPALITPQPLEVREELNASQASSDTADVLGDDVEDAFATQVEPTAITPATALIDDIRTSPTSVIDYRRRDEISDRFVATINNPRFWAKESRVKGLVDALAIPVFENRSLHQYYIHADSDLYAEAAKKSKADGVPAILPTEEEIEAEVWRRWVASETETVTKCLNKKRREEAKREGRKFIPVPTEEVEAIVAEAEAKLRASENRS